MVAAGNYWFWMCEFVDTNELQSFHSTVSDRRNEKFLIFSARYLHHFDRFFQCIWKQMESRKLYGVVYPWVNQIDFDTVICLLRNELADANVFRLFRFTCNFQMLQKYAVVSNSVSFSLSIRNRSSDNHYWISNYR